MSKHRVEIDWRATFRAFSDAHGGDPLTWKGRLLWRDGWRHSATDHRGPAYPPVDEAEAKKLSLVYWKLRLATVERERRQLAAHVRGLEATARETAAPLMMRRAVKDEQGRRMVTEPLDLSALRERLDWLDEDAAECRRESAELAATDEQKLAATETET